MVPDIQGSRNSRRGSLVIAMLGVVLLVTGVGTTVRLQSISKEQHPSSVTSKLSVTVTNRTVVATPPSPTAVPTLSSDTDSSDHGTTHFVTVDDSNGVVVVVCE